MAALHAIVHGFTKPEVLVALGAFSIVAFLATVVLVPAIVARMPADYFTHAHVGPRAHPVLVVLKNVAGVIIVLLGVAMLFLPGQGVLTVLLGLGLVDFPGRRRLELAVVRRPAVLNAVNALRRRFGRAPLEIPKRG